MTPERWERIAQVFDAAQAAPPESRADLLGRWCGADAELRAEVEALLTSAAAASGFLSGVPALSGTAPPPGAPPRWEAGARLAGRFQILRLLGRGGMGEVYAARDGSLGIEVALKVVRADIAADSLALVRFKREILTARRISQRNVCRIYDLAIEPGAPPSYFLTMELLPGETLADHLRTQGPPPEAQARRWLEQIAAGLDAAHAAGVIHRDFKPGNVLFRPGPDGAPEAVITDFGLARWTASEAAGSSGDRLIGTLAYMAPEQLAGDAVTPAADVYAFGLVAYELLCGQGAFAGKGPLGGVLQRLRQGHVPPSARRPGLDPAWDGVIAACLAEDPGRRAAGAGAALAALPPEPPPGRRLRRRAWPVGVAAGLTAVALVAALALARRARVPSQVAPGSELLLTPVTNTTGERQLDAVTAVLREQLAQSAQFRLTTAAQAMQQLVRLHVPGVANLTLLARRPALARQVALGRAAPLVVFAGVSRVGGEYRLAIDLERVGAGAGAAGTWRVTETAAGKDGLLDAVHAGANWIRSRAGEPANALAATDQPPQDIASSSWPALHDYGQALEAEAAGHAPQAMGLLRRAIGADSGFALAEARLGELLIAHNDAAAGYAAYRRALARANQRRLSLRERLRLETVCAEASRQWTAALRASQAYAALYPGDAWGWASEAAADTRLGDAAAARVARERAAAVTRPAGPPPAGGSRV